MSAWTITCTNSNCNKETKPANISYLMNHLDEQGWFLCKHCESRGYIKKEYRLQGKGADLWKPYLQGVIRPREHGRDDIYQPFAFLVGYSSELPPEDVWFCYYKDTTEEGGRLKMGHGPGGPPVFQAGYVLDLVVQMIEGGCLDRDNVINVIQECTG